MKPAVRRAAMAAALLALLGLGCALRVVSWREAPPGPWIDEALGLRAARIAAATGAPLVGTTPLQPPDAGFVNFWVTNPALRALSTLDRAAGGGMASVRAASLVPSLLLLLATAALAAEAARRRPFGVLATLAVLSTSSWLLVTGRWGWIAVGTSAVVVLSALAALRALRKSSPAWAAVAGGLLGLSAWGYVAAWALAPLPLLFLLLALVRRREPAERRRAVGLAGAAAVAWALVVAPLAMHFVLHTERAVARPQELSPARGGAGEILPALGRNVLAYARLFAVGGDPNERHGDPSRPVLPVAVTCLALAGAASGLRGEGAARLLAAGAGLLLLASLLAIEGSANAFRTSLAAPFLVVLAGLGAESLADVLGPLRRRFATAVLAVVISVASATDAAAFLRWLSSPRLYGAFGGPERDLADAVAAELATRGPADVLLAPGAARNAFVVDALLQDPRCAAPAIRQGAGLSALRYIPSRDVLFADAATAAAAAAARGLGAFPVASGGVLPGHPGWTLWRVPAARAAAAARAFLEGFPPVPARGTGSLLVPEEGLYTFSSRGGIDVRLDGGVVFDSSRRAGALSARLSAGRHDLAVRVFVPGALLRVTGPDGFVLPSP